MYDLVNLVMLVCAALAALALGVMLGYTCCKGLFVIMRSHARIARAERVKTAVVSTIIS